MRIRNVCVNSKNTSRKYRQQTNGDFCNFSGLVHESSQEGRKENVNSLHYAICHFPPEQVDPTKKEVSPVRVIDE